MAKVLCLLYDDPVDGHPKTYARDAIPRLKQYPDGRTPSSREAIDRFLGRVARELVR
jgi:formate dehydrogenase